jgi:hypothetical protein
MLSLKLDKVQFKNVASLFHRYGYFSKDPRWRLVPHTQGHINGLDKEFCGTRVATNGVLCFIVRADDSFVLGHDGWWIKHKAEGDGNTTSPRKFKGPNPMQVVQDLLMNFV